MFLAGSIASCRDDTATAGSGGTLRAEAFCSMPGLPAALRQTIIVIDGRELAHAVTPQDIRERNGAVIDAVTAIAHKTLAPRERLKIVLAPTDGLQPKLLFTGCLPGFSADELRAARSKMSGTDSAAKSFFGQDESQKAAEALESFQTTAVGALVQAAKDVPEGLKSDAGVPFASSSVVQSLRSGNGLIDLEDGTPRIFLLSNLARFEIGSPNDATEARKAGFEAGATSGLNLSRAELHVMLAKAGSAFARDYASAFFLRSEASLVDWGRELPASLPNPPTKLTVFTGSVDYVHAVFPVQARLATDLNGNLVNSWILVKNETERAVPITGALNCNESQVCTFTEDQGGFAQVWSPKFGSGGKPDFAPDLPFGGLRSVELTITNGKVKGSVLDPTVSDIGGKPSLQFQMNECDRCRL
jgi:hypothetical protein